jgi:CobQ-like glutamine amidotransferase family enzyme
MTRATESAVRIALVFPELLGTYGDRGNATVLAQRLQWRGHAAELVPIGLDTTVPGDCDLYVLGGGEDAPQALATDRLDASGFTHAADRGAVVLAICAGLQILGRTWTASDGAVRAGLGLLDCTTRPKGERQIGELVVEPTAFDLPTLTGFENHGGITELGPNASPMGRASVGFGNGSGGVEGVVSGHVVGSYLHGPSLARNPALADLLLTWVVGPLEPLEEPLVDRLRTQRLDAALGSRRRR